MCPLSLISVSLRAVSTNVRPTISPWLTACLLRTKLWSSASCRFVWTCSCLARSTRMWPRFPIYPSSLPASSSTTRYARMIYSRFRAVVAVTEWQLVRAFPDAPAVLHNVARDRTKQNIRRRAPNGVLRCVSVCVLFVTYNQAVPRLDIRQSPIHISLQWQRTSNTATCILSTHWRPQILYGVSMVRVERVSGSPGVASLS